MVRYATFVLLVLLAACSGDDEVRSYGACDGIGASCPRGTSDPYCTRGHKWGADNPFATAGRSVSGPVSAGGLVTYSFRDGGFQFSTHAQTNIISQPIARLGECGQNKVREAFKKWEAVADITFEEVSNPDASDVDIIVADIHVTGLGYSAYVDDLCRDIAGQVIFYVPIFNCESFTTLALHEVGHVLGLGHVGSDNIMNPDWGDSVTELQPGDIAGIQSIYGAR